MRAKWFAYKETPCKVIFHAKVFLDRGSQSYLDRQKNFAVDIKSTILPQFILVLYSFLQYLDIFLESFKKGVHKNFTNYTENHLNRVPFCNKAAGWRYAT